MLSNSLPPNKTLAKLAAPLVVVVGLAGCSTTDTDNAVLGGATGAVIGGVATGSLKGAAVGGAIGAGAGVLIGRVADGSRDCYFRRPWGKPYIARCRQ